MVCAISNQATAEAVVVNGFVVEIKVVFGGDGYFSAPEVSILGNGSGASAVAQVKEGKVTKINVLNAGFGYTEPVVVTIGPSGYPDVTDIQIYSGIKIIGSPGTPVQLQYASTLDDPFPWQPVTNFIMSEKVVRYFEPLDAFKRYFRTIAIPTNANPADFVWIPAGTFLMGSPTTDASAQPDETQHPVTLTEGFFIGRHEVTQSEYSQYKFASPSIFKQGTSLPVENVSWADAMSYCEALTLRERGAGRLAAGYVYRLPTEAEWEYAARASTTSPFHFGSDVNELADYAWYTQNSGGHEVSVGTLQGNPWNIFDMYGNVAEWCLDWYGAYPIEREFNPLGTTNGTSRVVRGGYWGSAASECRSASRSSLEPTSNSAGIGFRIVLARGSSASEFVPDGAQFVWIPPGTFNMGSPAGELERRPDETLHQVTLTRGFWVARYLVTAEPYTELTGIQTGGVPGAPVNVSWKDATNYCLLLTKREWDAGRLSTNFTFRLPTEAEWEFMARAGTSTRYYWGDDLQRQQVCTYVNCTGRFEPVGSRPPNPAGVYDVVYSGTTGPPFYQWCSDIYGPYQIGKVTDPKGPANGTERVGRGSSSEFRSAYRFHTDASSLYGFIRLVLSQR